MTIFSQIKKEKQDILTTTSDSALNCSNLPQPPLNESFTSEIDNEGDISDEDLPPQTPPTLMRTNSLTGEDMQTFYNSIEGRMPECAEKTLVLLYVNYKCECDRPLNVNPLIEDKSVIFGMLSKLSEQLEIENSGQALLASAKHVAAMVNNSVDESDILEKLQQLVTEIRPLDLDLMLDYIEKNSDGAELIENKDIIILLGGSGRLISPRPFFSS